ncbi:hypothetical protein HAHI6034_10895 [Hathewaya histolytica]|uniref:Uncharacterized protein n=1 Tax=Hathewaya histolytica TaxID=1498 RepID=A0A4U9REF8_HATHI|nr:hypothetical protein [Hathewaya histolytica]VTQ88733.1 Uncharacterised protein [Hathewaya histolytica]
MATPIDILKFNLQENNSPHFEEDALKLLLEQNDNDVLKATIQGLQMKAQVDSFTLGPIKIDSNRDYWLSLIDVFKEKLREKDTHCNSGSGYKTSMRRVDGQ